MLTYKMFWRWLSKDVPSPPQLKHFPKIDSSGAYQGICEFGYNVNKEFLDYPRKFFNCNHNLYLKQHKLRNLINKIKYCQIYDVYDLSEMVSFTWSFQIITNGNKNYVPDCSKRSRLLAEQSHVFENATIFRMKYYQILTGEQPANIEFLLELCDLSDVLISFSESVENVKRSLKPKQRKNWSFSEVVHVEILST